MQRREILVLVAIFAMGIMVIGAGIYAGQYSIAYKTITGNRMTYNDNGYFSSDIINLSYEDVLSVVSNVTPYLVPFNSSLIYNMSSLNSSKIAPTNQYGDIYIYPSLEGSYQVIIPSHFRPEFNYTITIPTVFSFLSSILIIIGIAMLIAGVAMVYLTIARTIE